MTFLSKLNKRFLITPKILYLTLSLAYFSLHQFRTAFITGVEIGKSDSSKGEKISDANFGFIYGIIMCMSFFTNIFIGGVSDKVNSSRLSLFAVLAISTVGFQALFSSSLIKNLASFWGVIGIYIIFNASLMPILDNYVLKFLSDNNIDKNCYGRQRLIATLAFPLGNFMIETLIASTNTKGDKVYDFKYLQYYQLFFAGLSILFVGLFVGRSRQNETATVRRNILHDFAQLCSNYVYLMFILIIFLNGVTRSAMTMYLQKYIDNDLKVRAVKLSDNIHWIIAVPVSFVTGKVNSTMTLFAAISEISLFFFAGKITKTLGFYWPLFIAQVAQLIRFMGYYMLSEDSSNKYFIVCTLETLKGFNFGLTHISAVQLANSLCPPHLKATSQLIYGGTFVGLSSFFTGVVLKRLFGKDCAGKFGKFYLFLIGCTIVSFLLLVVFKRFLKRNDEENEKQEVFISDEEEINNKLDNNNDNIKNTVK